MKLDTKTALGIDISNGRINLALLRRNSNGVELVKTASAPVPEGAVKNGNVEDPALLARGIRELKTHNRIRVKLRQAAVSLVARPMFMQIIEVPKQDPTSVGRFVHNEVKHCVAFSGKKIALDFCGVGAGGKLENDRVFVVAADSQKVAEIVKACSLARVNIEAIEPPLVSYIRAFYAKKISGRFDRYVLLAVLQNNVLILCVFKKQNVDFVRTRDITGDIAEHSDLYQWVAKEINAVIQFYNIEAPDSPGKWEIAVVVDEATQLHVPQGMASTKDAEEFLKAKIACEYLQVKKSEDTYQDMPIKQSKSATKAGNSVVAVGLALRLLAPEQSNLKINLLPAEAAEVKSLKRHAIITGNIISAVLLIMVLAIGSLMFKIEKVNANIAKKKQQQSLQNISELIKEDKLLDIRIKQLSDGPGQLKEILSTHHNGDWLGLLNDLGSRAPKTVCITNLFSKGSSKIFLEGLALSYESVHLFVSMLDKSEYVDSAFLIEAEKDEESGLVKYSINCSLKSREGI